MKHINLVIFASILHDSVSVMNSRKPLLESIRSFAEVDIIYPSMLSSILSKNKYSEGGDPLDNEAIDFGEKDKDQTATVCFIATGGTEEIFKTFFSILPKPIYILSDGLHNSLAASFEICTFLNDNGIDNALFNAPLDNSPAFFKQMDYELFSDKKEMTPITEQIIIRQEAPSFSKNVMHYFAKAKIGLIGGESSWLISSKVDTSYIEKKYDVKFIDIPISELENEFHSINDDSAEVKSIVSKMNKYLIGDRTTEDLKEAAKMYSAIKVLCTKYQLKALTIKCFSLLDTCTTTSCLALALLNNEGIVSGCEGDIQTLWTMMYCYAISSKCSFMANPSSSNKEELTVDFAHCTIPLSIVHGFRLPSHFESSIGIGISGSVPCGKYNLIKFSGFQLEKYYHAVGTIIMNTTIEQRCRTQIRFKFTSEEEFDNFMDNRSGNHYVLYAK